MSVNHPLAAVVRRREKILAAIANLLGRIVTGQEVSAAAEAVTLLLPKGCKYGAVYQSLITMVGTVPDRAVLKRYAWALAGDTAALKADRPARPGVLPIDPSRVVIQVLAAERVPPKTVDGEAKTRYRFRVAAGPGSPNEFDVVWADRFIRFLAVRPGGLGFGRPPRGNRLPTGRPYQHPDTLVGMLLRVKLSVDASGRPTVSDVCCPPAIQKFNRALTEMRFRAGFACPFGFTNPCHQCQKGQQSCPAACRPLDTVQEVCKRCTKVSAHDPFWGKKVCVRCSSKPSKKIPLTTLPTPSHDKTREETVKSRTGV